jgi:hypothetical protein
VPSCVTVRSIELLNELQQARHVYVIVPHLPACEEHLAVTAPNVRCVHEGTVVPGLNKTVVSETLTRNYPHIDAEVYEKGRSPAGWYLQQVRLIAKLHCLKLNCMADLQV